MSERGIRAREGDMRRQRMLNQSDQNSSVDNRPAQTSPAPVFGGSRAANLANQDQSSSNTPSPKSQGVSTTPSTPASSASTRKRKATETAIALLGEAKSPELQARLVSYAKNTLSQEKETRTLQKMLDAEGGKHIVQKILEAELEEDDMDNTVGPANLFSGLGSPTPGVVPAAGHPSITHVDEPISKRRRPNNKAPKQQSQVARRPPATDSRPPRDMGTGQLDGLNDARSIGPFTNTGHDPTPSAVPSSAYASTARFGGNEVPPTPIPRSSLPQNADGAPTVGETVTFIDSKGRKRRGIVEKLNYDHHRPHALIRDLNRPRKKVRCPLLRMPPRSSARRQSGPNRKVS